MAVPSRFAGMIRAVEFAYGCGSGFPAPLTVDIGNSATGAGTLTLSFGYTKLSDGTVIYPLSTNASILAGVGTNSETVTPSAAAGSGNPGYDTNSVTATFANLHGTGDSIASGSFGLQEAINYASAKGGGIVVVDSQWAQSGGTQAMFNAATLPTNGTVSIQDNRSAAGGIQGQKFVVTNTATKALFSAPISLLPAPGTTAMYDIQDVVVENVFLTAAFAAGGAIQLSYGTGVTTPASATIPATFLTSPAASQMIKVGGALASTLSSAVLNKAIFLAAATADFTTGSGSLVVWVTYRVLNGF